MSNLLTNRHFSSPSISSNSYIYFTSWTSTKKSNLYWTTTSSTQLALINGNVAFGYPSISGKSFTQYISFQSTAELEQNVNISSRSNLSITFNYGYQTVSTFPPNIIKNYSAGLLLDTLPNYSLTQGRFSYSKTIYSNSGQQLL